MRQHSILTNLEPITSNTQTLSMYPFFQQTFEFLRLYRLRRVYAALVLLTLAACSSPTTLQTEQAAVVDPGDSYTLKLLHINDHHSHLDDTSLPLMLNAGAGQREPILVPVGGFARVASAMKELAGQAHGHTIKIHAGDAITGDLYYSLTDGQADADLMDVVCFDTLTLGNHEFDYGDAALKRFIDRLKAGECKTSVLSANVRFDPASALNQEVAPDYVQPWVILEREGRRIGLVGITVAGKTQNASRPDAGTIFADETASAQAAIDTLESQGVDIIVLQTHQGYKADLALAKSLRGVDVIIGGDSHTLLGAERMTDYGLAPQGPYPTHTTDQNGNPVCIAQAAHYGYVVGELNIRFDESGRMLSCDGRPHVLIGTEFKPARRDRGSLGAAEINNLMADIADSGFLRITDADTLAVAALKPHKARKLEFGSSIVVHANETLCARRMPGQISSQGSPGRGSHCGTSRRVAQHGGDIQQLVAEAYLQQARNYFQADLALINAGGVRTDIPSGPVTVQDIYTLLPFKNTLVQLKITGSMLKAAVESAIDAALAPQPSSGAYPYAAGMRWRLNPLNSKGSRLTNIQIQQADGSYAPLDPNRIYAVATIDFIADGKDHYQPFKTLEEHQRVDVGLDATQLFLDYASELAKQGLGLKRLALDDYSTQAVIGTSKH